MKSTWTFALRLTVLTLLALLGRPAFAVEPAPAIASISQPVGGEMQVLFHGGNGPFTVQMRASLDVNSPWVDIPTAKVTQVNTGVFLAFIPMGDADAAFYRIVSAGETVVELKGWTIQASVSAPANGTHFVAGEAPVVTVKILDNLAGGVTKSSLSTFNLYMYGPEDPAKTVTPLMLGANMGRSGTHHYIKLSTDARVAVNGNTLTYTLQPVTTEEPGTYTMGIRATLSGDGLQSVIKYLTVQIGTSVVENKLFATANCAECHQGPVSGKLYMHHVDPGYSPTGSWDLDIDPAMSCKLCHNNNGYAAYTDPVTGAKVSDHIVFRVHGVHMGEGLKNYWNTNKTNGVFADYTPVVFPADVRNCTACHTDDRWKTAPTALACGACHDSVYFGSATTPTNMVAHTGGPQANDQYCSFCHSPDTGSFSPISVAHAITPITREFGVELAMSAPASGQYYVAGEAPQVTLKVKDKLTGLYVDPYLVAESNSWNRAILMVAGPRSDTKPVLTPYGLTNTTSSYAQNDVRLRNNAANNDAQVINRTADSIVYQLYPITNLTAGTYTVYVEVRKASTGNYSVASLNFQVDTATVEPLPASGCADCHGDTVMHATSRALAFSDVDACKMCHDYKRQDPTRTSWTSGQYGFRTGPLSRRVHGVHYGRYVHKPAEIQSHDYSEVIFPQDVRNCTKCHTETSSWTEKPSRLACFACHDSDDAVLHGTSMTLDPTPADPWNGDEIETCAVCHGKGKSFTPSAVHAISNPYVPPYRREPAE